MCVEATPPARINAAIVRGGGPVRVVRVPYGKDHLDRWLDPDAERVLARSIYRRLEEFAPKAPPQIDTETVHRIVSAACERYGVDEDLLANMKIRKHQVKQARAYIIQELWKQHGMSEKSIAEILRFKHKSCVTYWLSVPLERMSA